MLVGDARSMEGPIDECGGQEYDYRVSKDDAPIRENSLIEVVARESREPIMFLLDSHYSRFRTPRGCFFVLGTDYRNRMNCRGYP